MKFSAAYTLTNTKPKGGNWGPSLWLHHCTKGQNSGNQGTHAWHAKLTLGPGGPGGPGNPDVAWTAISCPVVVFVLMVTVLPASPLRPGMPGRPGRPGRPSRPRTPFSPRGPCAGHGRISMTGPIYVTPVTMLATSPAATVSHISLDQLIEPAICCYCCCLLGLAHYKRQTSFRY